MLLMMTVVACTAGRITVDVALHAIIIAVIKNNNLCMLFSGLITTAMKGTKVKTLGGRAVAGAWLVAWAIMAVGAIINTHAHR